VEASYEWATAEKGGIIMKMHNALDAISGWFALIVFLLMCAYAALKVIVSVIMLAL
jgi:hypothetical protein